MFDYIKTLFINAKNRFFVDSSMVGDAGRDETSACSSDLDLADGWQIKDGSILPRYAVPFDVAHLMTAEQKRTREMFIDKQLKNEANELNRLVSAYPDDLVYEDADYDLINDDINAIEADYLKRNRKVVIYYTIDGRQPVTSTYISPYIPDLSSAMKPF